GQDKADRWPRTRLSGITTPLARCQPRATPSSGNDFFNRIGSEFADESLINSGDFRIQLTKTFRLELGWRADFAL
ncbi:hypothetical protein, partial [Aurantiacibacter flavus]